MDASYDTNYTSFLGTGAGPDARTKELERELLVTREKLNEEIGRLTREHCSLRSQLERSEAARQKVELELTRAKRREDELCEQNEDLENVSKGNRIGLEAKVTQLSKQCREWKITLDAVHRARVQEKQEQEILLKQKGEKNAQLSLALDKLHQENRASEDEVSQLQHNHESLDNQLRMSMESNRKLTQNNELLSAAVDTSKDEVLALREELKSYQQGLDNERTNAMEMKFNSEVLSLKVQDMERLLVSEREISHDCRNNMEQNQESRRTLEKKREEDLKICQELNEKLIRTEAAHRGLQDQLFTKQNLVSELSEQLTLHQENFAKLRDELEHAKLQQSGVQEEYTREMRQVETVLNSFHRDYIIPSSSYKNKDLPHKLQFVLSKMQQEIESSKAEFQQLKQSYDTLNSEYNTYRDLIQANNGTMREAEEKLNAQEGIILDLKREFETKDKLTQSLQLDLEKISRKKAHVKDELEKSQKNKQIEIESHSRFLHSLYQYLIHGQKPPVHEISHQGDPAPLSWTQLANMVSEQIEAKLITIAEFSVKLTHSEKKLNECSSKFNQIQSLYNKSLERCAELEHTLQGTSREKHNLEGELTHLTEQSALSHREREGKEGELVARLNELEGRSVSQEQELDQAFETLAKREQELTMFLSALAMLTSTLIPSLSACSELAVQKNILQNEFIRLHRLKQQVSELVSALQEEAILSGIIPAPQNALFSKLAISSSTASKVKSSPTRKRRASIAQSVTSVQNEFINSPAMKLRRGIIAVLATKRFFYIYKEKRNAIKLCVKVGARDGLATPLHITPGDLDGKGMQQTMERKGDPYYHWMTNPDLHELVMRSMLEAYAYIRSKQEKEQATSLRPDRALELSLSAPYQTSRGPHPAENSLKSLLTNLQAFFPASLSVHSLNDRWGNQGWSSSSAGMYETHSVRGENRPSLISLLGDGLNAQIRKHQKFVPVENIGMMLEAGLLGLISRLKEAEVTKSRLQQNLLRAEKQGNELKEACQQALKMEDQVDHLSDQLKSHVPREKYQNLSSEFQEAIGREQQTQVLLSSQTEKIEQLKGRLQRNTLDLQRRESSLHQSLQELTQVKQDSARANQQSRLSDRQLAQLQESYQHTQIQLKDAQIALRTSSREREVLVKYLRRANHIFAEAKSKLHLSVHTNQPLELERMMSPSTDLLNSIEDQNNIPQLDSCIATVKTFLEFYQYSLGRISYLQSQLSQTQSHATALRQEVDAATRRQLTEAAISIDNPSRHTKHYSPLPEIAFSHASSIRSSPEVERDVNSYPRGNLHSLHKELRPESQITDTLSFAPLQGTPLNPQDRSDTPLSSDTYFRPIPFSPTPSQQGQQLGHGIAQSLEGFNLST